MKDRPLSSADIRSRRARRWASKIKEKLNMEGIPSPSGRQWNDSQIARVLRNVMYKGDIILQKTYKDSRRVSRVNRGEADQWYIAEDHPAIVDPAQWDRVQAIHAERRKHLDTPLPPAPEKPRSSFNRYRTNMLYCPYCGEKLIHKWSKGSREYWACKQTSRFRRRLARVCGCQHIADAWDVPSL